MEIICPIDEQFRDEISALLMPPPPHHVQEYFDNLVRTRKHCGIEVKQDREFGKGVYAASDFGEGELLVKDTMLVGAQHSSNKTECLVCSLCFRFIGSVELQIGRKLYFQQLGVSTDCGSKLSDGEGNSCMEVHDKCRDCSSSSSREKTNLPKEVVESLMNGEIALPHSKKFSLPSIVSCPGGCREAYYCSKSCAELDWEVFHSLLCTGEKSESLSREALLEFIQHANETNDIFLVAAKAISFTILKYRKLKAAHLEEQVKGTAANDFDNSNMSLLLEAWKPISMGYKKRWWDCIALPDDIESCDSVAFRMQIRELAFTSLQLLKAAIFDEECAPLFSLEIFGHIIGMFELNNLDLVVASPVEDYFLYIDELPVHEKAEAETTTRPILESLGDDYSVCCEGTAFFPLQSCMNHSCCPNAKAFKREEDRDGQATIISLQPICIGEEVTISYIDEDLPYKEREALLADYGFRCRCPRCLKEQT